MKRLIRVVAVGYFEIDEKDLKVAYSADSFEEALDNHRRWYNHDPNVAFQEYVGNEFPVDITFGLTHEGFDPENPDTWKDQNGGQDPYQDSQP